MPQYIMKSSVQLTKRYTPSCIVGKGEMNYPDGAQKCFYWKLTIQSSI